MNVLFIIFEGSQILDIVNDSDQELDGDDFSREKQSKKTFVIVKIWQGHNAESVELSSEHWHFSGDVLERAA